MSDAAVRVDYERVRSFTRALRVALYDVQQERAESLRGAAGRPLRYYFDADASMRMIIGFEHRHTFHTPASIEENFVRALLASGYLGIAILLPPHAWEVNEGIKRQVNFELEKDVELFADRARKYIDDERVSGDLDSLAKNIREGTSDDDILKKFVGMAPETFIAIEAVSGTWKHRLYRFTHTHLLRFDAYGWDIPNLLETTLGRHFKSAIGKVRTLEKLRKQSLMNNLRDAGALTALARMIADPAQFGRVRFYTETNALWKMIDDNVDGVVDQLSYPAVDTAGDSIFDRDCRCIFRSPTYYLVRARFAALRFPGVIVREGANDMSFDDLTAAASDLERILIDEERDERLVMRVRIEGKPLSATIEELESLSFIGSIWQKYDPPKYVREYFPEWTNIWDFIKTKGAVQLIDRQIGDIGQEFRGRLGLLTDWANDLLRIRAAVREQRFQCAGAPAPDPMKHLGLVRWGATLDDDHRKTLVRMIGELLDDADWEVTAQEVASWLHGSGLSGQDAIVLCAILWMLSEFEMVIHAANTFRATADPADSVSLQLLAVAAAVRGTTVTDKEEVQQKLHEVEERVLTALEEPNRYLLGLAYVHYYAWKNAGNNADSRKWAEASFRYGEQAVDRLQHSSLAWAFAVNHCVYVGYRAGMLTKAKPYRDKLIELYDNPAHWHFRFADTMAETHLIAARERLRTFVPQVTSSSVLDFIKKELERARKYLDLAEPSYGDQDTRMHRLEAESLQSELDAFRLDVV